MAGRANSRGLLATTTRPIPTSILRSLHLEKRKENVCDFRHLPRYPPHAFACTAPCPTSSPSPSLLWIDMSSEALEARPQNQIIA
ncbi:hypothetical protein PsYK624_066960 [Phanerochaete sordida]|uniref:Uncharacterized protein n=1 Tax=Phanerochaete sordida TaxID=48140 RepID=A0A9P3GA13_9APHY|nr:hypothetical protein PsYK624_066960 [Phanerochaete sordida]